MGEEGTSDVGLGAGAREERMPREDPEEYADPICVCEPEPYWQEVAEKLEREKAEREKAEQGR